MKPKVIGLRLSDLAGLVVGYSLAALLVRSFRNDFLPLGIGRITGIGVAFLWIGLALSGPILLLVDRRTPVGPPDYPTTHPPTRYTSEELAWVAIGVYLFVMTLIVVSARSRQFPWSFALLTQLILAVIVLIIRQPIRPHPGTIAAANGVRWTQRAAGVLILSWPVPWIALFLVLP